MRITQRLDSRSSHRRNEETPDNSPVFSREQNEQPTKAVHPGMRSFHHPPPCLETSLPLDRLSLFPAWTNVGRKAEFAQDGTHLLVVIPLRQTHPLRMLFAWLRTVNDDAFDSRSHQLHIVVIRSLNGEADRDAVPIGRAGCVSPRSCLGRSDWGRFFPPPNGALVIAPSIESQSQSIPHSSSNCSMPACQSLRKTPACTHS
jgi:hypothetical protein